MGSLAISALARRVRHLASRLPPLPAVFRSEAIRRAAAAAVLVGWPSIVHGATIFVDYSRWMLVRLYGRICSLKHLWFCARHSSGMVRQALRDLLD